MLDNNVSIECCSLSSVRNNPTITIQPSLPIESHVAGRNALQRAAMMGHLACVELLLQHNARVGLSL